MFNSVVVCLDGSELSEKALPYALKLANSLKVRLTLLRVVNFVDFPEATFQRDLKEATDYLMYQKKFLNYERKNPNLSINPDISILIGEPAEVICRYVKKETGVLLVMTTHGRTGLSRLMIGSVAEDVLKKLHLPVMLIRPFGFKHNQTLQELLESMDEPYAKTFLENGIRLLVPLDQTEKSEAALEPAFALAAGLKASINLITVNSPPQNVFYGESFTLAFSPEELYKRDGQVRTVAKSYLGQVTQLAREKGFEVTSQVVTGSPGRQLIKYASQIEPDLIVMATRARGNFGRMLFGSVANQLLQTTHLPILMVPATATGSDRKLADAETTSTGQLMSDLVSKV